MREFTVKDFTPLEDGSHQGKIVRVEYRDEPYAYVDFIILVEDANGLELKYGCPQNITTTSKLGKLIEVFGRTLTPEETITENDIEKLFVGKMMKFMTITEISSMRDGTKREFARVVDGSIKLINK